MASAALKPNKSDDQKRDPKKVHPTYASALAHLEQLQQQYRELESERRETETKIQRQCDVDPTDAAAEQVADGGDVPVQLTERRVKTLREHLGTIDQKRSVLAKAIELQHSKVEKELHTASIKVGENLASEYQQKVDRLADAMMELAAAQQDIFDFRDELEQTYGVNFGLGFTVPTNVRTGSFRDPASWVASWLHDQVKRGLISAKRIPSTWRKQWETNNPGFMSKW